MRYFLEKLYEESSNNRKKIKLINEYLKNAPEGYLKISRRKNDRYVYYQMLSKEDGSGQQLYHYISIKKDQEKKLIIDLVRKSYYIKLLKALEEETKAIEAFLESYHPQIKYDIYDQLMDARKMLIQPEIIQPSELIKKKVSDWEAEEWTPSNRYADNLKFETNRGEMVRSKSEMIIADLLDKNKEYCSYRYEDELYLEKSRVLLHPEFKIMKKRTGEILFWEHFGMMHNDGYVDDFIGKIQLYIKEGIYPGERLIMTFESPTKPLDTRMIKEIIYHYFVEENAD